MNMDSVIVRALILRGLKYGLKQLKAYMSTENFEKTVDEVLDRVEDYFKEGSTLDDVTEALTAEVREYFKIEDND